jgi:hypothetical protein
MNFLQICQEANRLSGMQGTLSTVASSTGYQYTLVRFVAQAWIDLQNLRKDWPFMRSTVDFNTTQAKTEYTLANLAVTDVARWRMLTYVDSQSLNQKLKPMSHDQYLLDNIAQQGQGAPVWYAVDPIDKHLYLNPPDAVYAVTGHYITEPVELTDNTDEPTLADSFHMVLAYLGGAHMAAFMGNSNLYNDLKFRADQMVGDLMRSETPARRAKLRGIA